MKNAVLQKELIDLLKDRFTTSDSVLINFSKGEDAYDPIKPQAVVFPNSNEELSKILKICNEHQTPVVPYGTGTSLDGHAVGHAEGITISLEEVDKILTVNAEDFDCRVQPNVSREQLNENLKGNIASTLSNYPNIGINSFGAVVSKPSLRGFSGDRFLLTKDGVETGDLSQSSIDHVITLDMSEVSEIEIIRGPRSLVYGLNAIGGIVNTSLIGGPDVRVDRFYQKIYELEQK